MTGSHPHASTSNDPQSQVQSESLQEMKEGHGIIGSVKDMFLDATARFGHAEGRATSSAAEPINKIQDKSNEAYETANRQLDNANQSQIHSGTEQKEGRGIFGVVKDMFHAVTAKSGDAADQVTASATEPINKIQDKSNEASEAATTQFANAKERIKKIKNIHQSLVLPDPSKENKEGHENFGAGTNRFHDATSKSGDAVGSASAAEPINKLRDKSNDASEAAKKQLDDNHQSHSFPEFLKEKKDGHGIFGSV
ncbi:hypothetical protein BC830DRAFT_857628 [Chytriomyces sp. MP71]|nr:hypothetical protein BC830DRAFT_857628 [Chytriomyces sp. MP71]